MSDKRGPYPQSERLEDLVKALAWQNYFYCSEHERHRPCRTCAREEAA